MDENERFQRGIAHFNAHEFFEAHEVWEEIWLRAPLTEKPFLQGLIQIAAAFHHYQRENLSGTKSLLAAGLAKLESASGHWRGIELARFLSETTKWLDELQSGRNLGSDRFPRVERYELGS